MENETNLPCLVYYHGGGFVHNGVPKHFVLSCNYAKQGFKVVFVHFRSAASSPFSCVFEDSYASLEWVYKNSSLLNIDPNKIAVGGDSAGGSIAAGITLMARDRKGPPICFQLLVFPGLSDTLSKKAAQLTHTPFFNARCFNKLRKIFFQPENLKYISPKYQKHFRDLPDAFIEVEEFDCLTEGSLAYAELLREGGAHVQVEQVKGTFHAYDMLTEKPLTKEMVRRRGQALLAAFEKQEETRRKG